MKGGVEWGDNRPTTSASRDFFRGWPAGVAMVAMVAIGTSSAEFPPGGASCSPKLVGWLSPHSTPRFIFFFKFSTRGGHVGHGGHGRIVR